MDQMKQTTVFNKIITSKKDDIKLCCTHNYKKQTSKRRRKYNFKYNLIILGFYEDITHS